MPKRKHESESKEEHYARKLRKYEEKLMEKRKKNRQRILYSSEEELDNTLEDGMDMAISPNVTDFVAFAEPPHECELNDNDQADELRPDPTGNIIAVPESGDITETDINREADIEPELLKALGDFEPEALEWGDNVQEDIAKRFQLILWQGLKKETKEELAKKYLFAKNIPFVKAPTLNPEISAMMVESFRNRDKRMFNKQDQLGRALSALSVAMTALLKKNPDLSEVIRILNDTGKLLADSHFTETESRRAMVIPLVDKSLIESFKDRKRDNMLFGEKLGDLVKNSRGIKRTGQYIQSTVHTASTSNLNWRGQPMRGRPSYRGGHSQSYQHRANGQRTQYASRRRAPATSIAGARRQTAAPPPPARRPPPPATRPPPPNI